MLLPRERIIDLRWRIRSGNWCRDLYLVKEMDKRLAWTGRRVVNKRNKVRHVIFRSVMQYAQEISRQTWYVQFIMKLKNHRETGESCLKVNMGVFAASSLIERWSLFTSGNRTVHFDGTAAGGSFIGYLRVNKDFLRVAAAAFMDIKRNTRCSGQEHQNYQEEGYLPDDLFHVFWFHILTCKCKKKKWTAFLCNFGYPFRKPDIILRHGRNTCYDHIHCRVFGNSIWA